MAMLPGDAYCHEFTCENERDQVFKVYINAATGEEENILMQKSSEDVLRLV